MDFFFFFFLFLVAEVAEVAAVVGVVEAEEEEDDEEEEENEEREGTLVLFSATGGSVFNAGFVADVVVDDDIVGLERVDLFSVFPSGAFCFICLFCLTLDDLICTFCFFFFWPPVGPFTGFLLGGIFVNNKRPCCGMD